MRPTRCFAILTAMAFVSAGCTAPQDDGAASAAGTDAADGRNDVVVVAVLDWQLNPYHWDYLAAHMPQHEDSDPSNDLPLDEDPASWLPGFPDPSTFASYGSLDLTLTPDDPDAVPEELYEKDKAEWSKVQQTTADDVHLRYIPGTKVVGFISTDETDGFAPATHGVGASSVSVGNLYGTCPSCLLVFVNIPGSAGEKWVRQQDWIDASTHSYEGSSSGVVRDNVSDCDTSTQQEAAERGQQIFWAAGNGLVNTFTIPQTTLVNCEKAPDWTVTVGAIHPDSHGNYIGHGKPVHVSNIGSGYPRAGGDTVTDESTFSGTSNASPVTAGIYAQALHRLRTATPNDERIQRDGVILEGELTCGDANPDCPVADGILTVHELRESFFRAAKPASALFQANLATVDTVDPATTEAELWTEGHGSFLGRLGDPDAEVQAVVDHATGAAHEEPDDDLVDWMTSYSWCVQRVWGTWDHGYWHEGDERPAPNPEWPQRTWMGSDLCPATVSAVVGRA